MFTIETTPRDILSARDYLIQNPEDTTSRKARKAMRALRRSADWGDRAMMRYLEGGHHAMRGPVAEMPKTPIWERALDIASIGTVGAAVIWILPMMIGMTYSAFATPMGV